MYLVKVTKTHTHTHTHTYIPEERESNNTLFFAAIYACTTYKLRSQLRVELTDLQQRHLGPQCFLGDINAMLGTHEKRGGKLPLHISNSDFQTWSNNCLLTLLPIKGSVFTWTNCHQGRVRIEVC